MKVLVYLFVVATFWSNTNFSFIESIDIWRHSKTDQLIYGVADYSWTTDEPEVMAQDRASFIKLRESLNHLASSASAHKDKIILEDASEYRVFHKGCEKYQQLLLNRDASLSRSPLLGLAVYAKEKGFSTHNVEFRFFRYAALYGNARIKENDLVSEFQEAFRAVQEFQDPLLKPVYNQILDSIKIDKKGELFSFFRNFSVSDDYRERVAYFDTRLIEANALHALFFTPLTKVTYMILCARHLATIKSVLERELGYTCIKHIGLQYSYPLGPMNKLFADDTTVHEPISVDELDCLGKNLDEL